MDINQARLKQNIARIRRDIRKTSQEMQALVDADLDCSGAARVLVHLQNDLRLYLEKQECGIIRRGEGSHPAPTSRPGVVIGVRSVTCIYTRQSAAYGGNG